MSKRALIVVDLQNEYLPTGRLPLVGIENATANAARVIEAARARGDVVIHIRHENPAANARVFVPDTTGVEIISSVQPAPGEPVVTKSFPNSFRGTNLEQLLDANGIEEVVVIGAMSHMCVDATTRAAADLGYGVTVIDDACATMNLKHGEQAVPAEQVHAAYMAALSLAYAKVIPTNALLNQ